jgi:hypothetical protein
VSAFAIVDPESGRMDGWYYSSRADVRRLADAMERETRRPLAVVQSSKPFPIPDHRRLILEQRP